MSHDDFYEEDEPLESLKEAFERGEKFTTARPPAMSLPAPWVRLGPPQTYTAGTCRTWVFR